jgi:acetyl esterase/lipase
MKRSLAALLGFVLLTVTVYAADPKSPENSPKSPEGVEAHFDVQYANPDNKPQFLDLYLPKEIHGKLPVVVAIHGGGWTGGDKRHVPVIPLASQGYAVASINYRFSQVAIFPAQIEDCKAAIRWVRAHADEFHMDADHIGVWGDSAGGHLVALLGTSAGVKELEGNGGNPGFSSGVQAVCDFYGPTDFLTINGQASNDAKVMPDDPKSAVSKLLGGPAPEKKENAKAASPVTYVSKDAAPFLIMHGDKDPLVPLAQSEELRDDLQKVGVEVELYVVKDAGHGFPHHLELAEKVRAFFDKHLKAAAEIK